MQNTFPTTDTQSDLRPPYVEKGMHSMPQHGEKTDFSDVKNYNAWERSRESRDLDQTLPVSESLFSPENVKSYTLLTKCAAEFMGEIIFVFVGTMQAHSTGDGLNHAALTHGLAIFILVTTLGHISGGHFNPAVSLAVCLTGKLPPRELLFYFVAQLLGSCVGALLTIAILTKEDLAACNAGATLLTSGTQWHQGLLAEGIVTFLLVHTILNTAVDTEGVVLAPLAIGLTLTIDIFAAGSITGASMNPARSFGPNVIGALYLDELPSTWWSYHYIYWAGPIMGALLAAAVFRLLQSRTKRIFR